MPAALAPILLALPDSKRAAAAQRAVQAAGLTPHTVRKGHLALQVLARGEACALVLDVDLPDASGFAICRRVRALPDGERIPVVFLTCRTDEATRVAALEAGADDVLTAPFSERELALRLGRLLRLAQAAARHARRYQLGSLELQPVQQRVLVAGTPARLTPYQLRVLQMLFERRGEYVSALDIARALWPQGQAPSARTISTLVWEVRQALGPARDYLQTRLGYGYCLQVPPAATGPGPAAPTAGASEGHDAASLSSGEAPACRRGRGSSTTGPS